MICTRLHIFLQIIQQQEILKCFWKINWKKKTWARRTKPEFIEERSYEVLALGLRRHMAANSVDLEFQARVNPYRSFSCCCCLMSVLKSQSIRTIMELVKKDQCNQTTDFPIVMSLILLLPLSFPARCWVFPRAASATCCLGQSHGAN